MSSFTFSAFWVKDKKYIFDALINGIIFTQIWSLFLVFLTRQSGIALIHVWCQAGHHTFCSAPCYHWNLQTTIIFPHFCTIYVSFHFFLSWHSFNANQKSNWKKGKRTTGNEIKNHKKVLTNYKIKSSTRFTCCKSIEKCTGETVFFGIVCGWLNRGALLLLFIIGAMLWWKGGEEVWEMSDGGIALDCVFFLASCFFPYPSCELMNSWIFPCISSTLCSTFGT